MVEPALLHAITMQQKESSIDFDTPPSTILLRNSYRKILSLKFIDEDHQHLMIICACHADTANPEEVADWRLFGPHGEPNMSKKFDLVVIQIASMTEIHCSSIRPEFGHICGRGCGSNSSRHY
jgi:hypothetical protein